MLILNVFFILLTLIFIFFPERTYNINERIYSWVDNFYISYSYKVKVYLFFIRNMLYVSINDAL